MFEKKKLDTVSDACTEFFFDKKNFFAEFATKLFQKGTKLYEFT